jgi:hypothetical protein
VKSTKIVKKISHLKHGGIIIIHEGNFLLLMNQTNHSEKSMGAYELDACLHWGLYNALNMHKSQTCEC